MLGARDASRLRVIVDWGAAVRRDEWSMQFLSTCRLANVVGRLELGGDGMLGWRSDREAREHGSLGLGFRGLGALG